MLNRLWLDAFVGTDHKQYEVDSAHAREHVAAILAGIHARLIHHHLQEQVVNIDAWHCGNIAQARQLGHRLVPLSAALFAEPNPVVIKAVLHAEGMIPSPMARLPLLEASRASVSAALDVLRGLAKAPAEILPRQASGVQG